MVRFVQKKNQGFCKIIYWPRAERTTVIKWADWTANCEWSGLVSWIWNERFDWIGFEWVNDKLKNSSWNQMIQNGNENSEGDDDDETKIVISLHSTQLNSDVKGKSEVEPLWVKNIKLYKMVRTKFESLALFYVTKLYKYLQFAIFTLPCSLHELEWKALYFYITLYNKY